MTFASNTKLVVLASDHAVVSWHPITGHVLGLLSISHVKPRIQILEFSPDNTVLYVYGLETLNNKGAFLSGGKERRHRCKGQAIFYVDVSLENHDKVKFLHKIAELLMRSRPNV